MSIEVRNITRRFDGFTALADVSLRVDPGQLVALLGPSGSGKTTLLRIIGGLDFPTSGQVLFDDEDASDRHAGARGVGFVFQHYALFNHLTIFENVAFGLRVRPKATRPAEAAVREKVERLLELVQLGGLAARYPHQLSGGQRQRIALARALAVEPKVLLLDEPFGALDARVRAELREWLRRLHEEVHVTSVFVTHDQDEAMEVADRIVVMNEGRIEQVGPPDEVYDRPASPFVLQFLGDVNLFHGRGMAKGARSSGSGEAVYVRPHELEIVGEPTDGALPATLSQTLTIGAQTRIEFKPDDDDGYIDVELPRAEYLALRGRLPLERGSRLWLLPRRVTRFEEDWVSP